MKCFTENNIASYICDGITSTEDVFYLELLELVTPNLCCKENAIKMQNKLCAPDHRCHRIIGYASIKVSRIRKTEGMNPKKVKETNLCSMGLISEHICKCGVDVSMKFYSNALQVPGLKISGFYFSRVGS